MNAASLAAYLTVESSVTVRAGALVRAVAIVARAGVQTWLRVALVDVVLTVVASEAGRAQTREGVDAVDAGASIKTGTVGRKTIMKEGGGKQ